MDSNSQILVIQQIKHRSPGKQDWLRKSWKKSAKPEPLDQPQIFQINQKIYLNPKVIPAYESKLGASKGGLCRARQLPSITSKLQAGSHTYECPGHISHYFYKKRCTYNPHGR